MMSSSSSPFFHRDEYIRSRDTQNTLLNDEFSSLRTSIDNVKRELREFKEGVGERFDAVGNRFDRLESDFNSLQLDSRRFFSWSRDAYLIDFYDLPYKEWHRNDISSGDSTESSSDDAARQNSVALREAVVHHTDRAVELLESILGLNPDNFERFHIREAELSNHTAQAIKRTVPDTQHITLPKRQRVDQPPTLDNAKSPTHRSNKELSNSLMSNDRVMWDDKSAASARKRVLARGAAAAAEDMIEDRGTTTNSDTLSRERDLKYPPQGAEQAPHERPQSAKEPRSDKPS
ncbi:hypothetical protein MKZ38_000199 [Zalerion maritima]|uniref:Uncharacterized protein n=1 Tax=Zalerion maritima TaxID=339359 RepID=A0AAD5RRV6_9PEZI|nr:hypothetical protein MKZ38_000199 [Zalerion maritima]